MTEQNLDRLKFQWFDLSTEIMYEVISLDVVNNYAVVRLPFADKYTPDEEVNLSDGNLRQSTSLKDKNGKLIYEGDIVKTEVEVEMSEEDESMLYDVVKWVDGAFCLCDGEWGLDKHTLKSIEVVGNIYENPELVD